MSYRVKWAKVSMDFDAEAGVVWLANPKILIGKNRREVPVRDVRAAAYVPMIAADGSASNFIRRNELMRAGIELRDGTQFHVPCNFKSDQRDGIAIIHAIGKAAGLVLLRNEVGNPHPRIVYGPASSAPTAPVQVGVVDERVCPFCAETIKAAAIVCRYCHRDLEPVVPGITGAIVESVELHALLTDKQFSALTAKYGKSFLEAKEAVDRLGIRPQFPFAYFEEVSKRIANGSIPDAAATRVLRSPRL